MTPHRARFHRAAALRFLPLAALSLLFPAMAGALSSYFQTNLVSDQIGAAKFLDPDLINPWGLSHSATSPWWVSDNASGLSTLYNGGGVKQALVVTIPGTGALGNPTGTVFNSTNDFKLSGGQKAVFLFASEDGEISGWNSGAGTTAIIGQIVQGAVYKGLTLGNDAGKNYLYAANFHNGTIDVFNSAFGLTLLGGSFTDPGLPSGYAPFDVKLINGQLYVTYALQDGAKHDDMPGAGHGYVSVFDTDGNFIKRLTSGDALDSPWGLALAPGNFGAFSNDLLVGNFGDGRINAFDPISGAFMGEMDDPSGTPIDIAGLWGLEFGNGEKAGPTNSLYFTAGPEGEAHGLFGTLNAVPEPHPLALLALGLIPVLVLTRRKG